jgi:small-conductance mechanosensitive channel
MEFFLWLLCLILLCILLIAVLCSLFGYFIALIWLTKTAAWTLAIKIFWWCIPGLIVFWIIKNSFKGIISRRKAKKKALQKEKEKKDGNPPPEEIKKY